MLPLMWPEVKTEPLSFGMSSAAGDAPQRPGSRHNGKKVWVSLLERSR